MSYKSLEICNLHENWQSIFIRMTLEKLPKFEILKKETDHKSLKSVNQTRRVIAAEQEDHRA